MEHLFHVIYRPIASLELFTWILAIASARKVHKTNLIQRTTDARVGFSRYSQHWHGTILFTNAPRVPSIFIRRICLLQQVHMTRGDAPRCDFWCRDDKCRQQFLVHLSHFASLKLCSQTRRLATSLIFITFLFTIWPQKVWNGSWVKYFNSSLCDSPPSEEMCPLQREWYKAIVGVYGTYFQMN